MYEARRRHRKKYTAMAMEMIIQISDILVTATATLKPLFPVDGNEPAMKQE